MKAKDCYIDYKQMRTGIRNVLSISVKKRRNIKASTSRIIIKTIIIHINDKNIAKIFILMYILYAAEGEDEFK
jgi:hypothetical protein